MIRISFVTVGDWQWETDGRGDERVDIAIPRPGEDAADIAVFNLPEYGHGWEGEEPPWRHYTIRAVRDEGRRFDIDFVLHGDGIASSWAERAEAGHIIGVFHGGGAYYRPPQDTQVQFLIADATGLPGLGRILEELDAGARAIAICEVADPEDIQEIRSAGDVEFQWLTGSGNGLGPSALPSSVAELPDPGVPWYAWVACEASTSRTIRRDLRTRLGSPRDRHHVIGYWSENLTGDRPADIE
jgi:NADPH-dependent ferric siderophore reductase